MIGVICFTVIACVLSIVITILNNYLFKNNKEEELLKMLPGYNCGACGFGSCSGMMHALLKDKYAINKCRVCKNKDEIIKFLGDMNEK